MKKHYILLTILCFILIGLSGCANILNIITGAYGNEPARFSVYKLNDDYCFILPASDNPPLVKVKAAGSSTVEQLEKYGIVMNAATTYYAETKSHLKSEVSSDSFIQAGISMTKSGNTYSWTVEPDVQEHISGYYIASNSSSHEKSEESLSGKAIASTTTSTSGYFGSTRYLWAKIKSHWYNLGAFTE